MIEEKEFIHRIRRKDTGQLWNGATWSQTSRSYTSLSDAKRTVSRCAPQFKGLPLEIVTYEIVEHSIRDVDTGEGE